jgi:hypothetical protein
MFLKGDRLAGADFVCAIKEPSKRAVGMLDINHNRWTKGRAFFFFRLRSFFEKMREPTRSMLRVKYIHVR